MGVISRMTMRVFAIVLFLSASSGVFAGQLILKNTSSSPITCTVDGWTRASGGSFDWFIKVEPGQSFYVGQNTSRPNPPIINWANCNNLQTRAMTLTPKGPNFGIIFFDMLRQGLIGNIKQPVCMLRIF